MKSIRDAHRQEDRLHEKEERLHKVAERAEKADKKLHKKIARVHKKEDKKDPKPKSALSKKMKKVFHEFGKGELHSGSKKGPIVKNPKQAVAIAFSEGRKAEGKKISKTIKKDKKKKK